MKVQLIRKNSLYRLIFLDCDFPDLPVCGVRGVHRALGRGDVDPADLGKDVDRVLFETTIAGKFEFMIDTFEYLEGDLIGEDTCYRRSGEDDWDYLTDWAGRNIRKWIDAKIGFLYDCVYEITFGENEVKLSEVGSR